MSEFIRSRKALPRALLLATLSLALSEGQAFSLPHTPKKQTQATLPEFASVSYVESAVSYTTPVPKQSVRIGKEVKGYLATVGLKALHSEAVGRVFRGALGVESPEADCAGAYYFLPQGKSDVKIEPVMYGRPPAMDSYKELTGIAMYTGNVFVHPDTDAAVVGLQQAVITPKTPASMAALLAEYTNQACKLLPAG